MRYNVSALSIKDGFHLKSGKTGYTLAVIMSGCLWGTMGFFRRNMGDLGLESGNMVMIRCMGAAVLYALTILFTNPSAFVIKPKDIWCFLGSGVVSLLFFSSCYFQAMSLMSLSAAAILLYTSPVFVMIMSAILFREKITVSKVLALILVLVGCLLTSGLIGSGTRISGLGLGYGLCSGFGYALYSIFSKFALQRGYRSVTVNLYSTLFAALGAGFIWGFRAPLAIAFASGSNLILCISAAIVTTYLPYYLYTLGLVGIEAGKASIICSIELVVAALVGLVVFGERLSLPSVIGMVLVLASIVLLNGKEKTAAEEAQRSGV